jgi:hypothetical protein
MCWAKGFKALHNKPFVATPLHLLDRMRLKQIRRFGRAHILSIWNWQIMNPWRAGNLTDKLKGWVFVAFNWLSQILD